ncbi:MAG: hypothetical protein CM1200mP2_10770 [Planctomycetaceae bacterium]|nr:MAG: hypothetical protein CM1200mP2_10770 [Planctomycetaceae bacterium]
MAQVETTLTTDELRERVDRLPRLPLGHLPTPLEYLPRFTQAIGGPPVYIKRDDCTGLAFGGNKTRHNEFLIADALEKGAELVVWGAGVQSNNCRQTAAACARPAWIFTWSSAAASRPMGRTWSRGTCCWTTWSGHTSRSSTGRWGRRSMRELPRWPTSTARRGAMFTSGTVTRSRAWRLSVTCCAWSRSSNRPARTANWRLVRRLDTPGRLRLFGRFHRSRHGAGSRGTGCPVPGPPRGSHRLALGHSGRHGQDRDRGRRANRGRRVVRW